MRAGGGDVKLFGVCFPAVLFVKPDRRDAGVAPKTANVGTLDNGSFGAGEQCAAEAAALIIAIGAHAAELPGGRLLISVEHKAGGGNERGFFIWRPRMEEADVPGGGVGIAGKLRGFAGHSGAQEAMAKADDFIDGQAANENALRFILE